jgi:MSHA pilin protein MshA
MDREAQGFTLIELIVLIGILAIMAAVAYPRFIMLETEARVALVTSLGGSVNAAAQQAHYLWILQGQPAAISMEGQSITMLNGYPADASIDDSLMDYTGFQFRLNPKPARFRRTDAVQPNNCMVTYADATAGSRPAIVAYTSGC